LKDWFYLSGRRSFPWGRRRYVGGESSGRRHRRGRLAGQATLLKPKQYNEGKDWLNEWIQPSAWGLLAPSLATGRGFESR
jgi:hypothetical protein